LEVLSDPYFVFTSQSAATPHFPVVVDTDSLAESTKGEKSTNTIGHTWKVFSDTVFVRVERSV
jgi:hypothetical protein